MFWKYYFLSPKYNIGSSLREKLILSFSYWKNLDIPDLRIHSSERLNWKFSIFCTSKAIRNDYGFIGSKTRRIPLIILETFPSFNVQKLINIFSSFFLAGPLFMCCHCKSMYISEGFLYKHQMKCTQMKFHSILKLKLQLKRKILNKGVFIYLLYYTDWRIHWKEN